MGPFIVVACALAFWTLGLLTAWSMCVTSARADRRARTAFRMDTEPQDRRDRETRPRRAPHRPISAGGHVDVRGAGRHARPVPTTFFR